MQIHKSTAEKVKLWRKNIKSKIVTSLGGKCSCCGYNKCFDALDLHHINPNDKEFSFGSIRANPKSWIKIVTEIKKCLLVCANCHREIHHGITKMPNIIPVFDERYSDYDFGLEKDKCPVCNKYKEVQYKTCSKKCAGKFSWSIDWSKFDLNDLLLNKKMSLQEIELLIGIPIGTIRKKAKSLGIIISLNNAIKKPSKEELEVLIPEKPFTHIAKQFGIKSSNTIRKWCVEYKIDYKSISKFSKNNIFAKPKPEPRLYPSKYIYVSFDSKRNKWCANIKSENKFFKRYNTELEAAQAVAKHFNSNILIMRK